MTRHKQARVAGWLVVVAALGWSQPAGRAVSFTETGDAGQTLATAQPTAATPAGAGVALTAITGTIAGVNGLDADVYEFSITSTTTFSAVASSTAGIDTSLFLFSGNGTPLLANDDASTTSFQAALPAGNTILTSLGAGTYYLGISLSGNEAVNSQGQQLFTVDQPTTNVRGTASGLNPALLGTFNAQTFVAEGGAYSVALTGAATFYAVPEPGTWASLAVGLVGLGALARSSHRRLRAA